MPELLLFDEGVEAVAGFFSNRERGVNISLARIAEANDLIYNGVYRGRQLAPHERDYLLREALTTSDFPYLFGDVLDRQVLANYKAVDPVWKPYTRMSTVPRIHPQVGGYRFAMTGGDQLLAEVAEKGEYLASERSEARYPVSVKKYGRQFDISWEAIINDDLGALQDTPTRFARAAVRTEHRLVTATYADNTVGGAVHTAGGGLYSTNAAELNENALALTVANLQTNVALMEAFTDANGEPILNRPKYLVVPPSLAFTAMQILESTTIMGITGTAQAALAPTAMFPMTNVIAKHGLQLIVDPYLPVVDAASAASWYLFADPADIAAMEVDYLAGHERPEICMKASDKVNIAGGPISAMSGDFATDNIFYRVRDVIGCNRLDWRATFMSHS